MKKLLAFCLSVCLFAVFCTPVSADSDNIYGCCTNDQMKIALTFDDGPHPRYTPRILEVLEKYDIKATFFMVGENVGYYTEVAQAVADAGHEIGNHTFSHPHIKNLSEKMLESEAEKCENAVLEVTGRHTTLFRPPEGVIDGIVKTMSKNRDFSVILWSVDTRDWSGVSAASIYKKVMKTIESGDIILMHDYITKNCHTVEAVELIIPALLEKGYKFVTVSELIGEKNG